MEDVNRDALRGTEIGQVLADLPDTGMPYPVYGSGMGDIDFDHKSQLMVPVGLREQLPWINGVQEAIPAGLQVVRLGSEAVGLSLEEDIALPLYTIFSKLNFEWFLDQIDRGIAKKVIRLSSHTNALDIQGRVVIPGASALGQRVVPIGMGSYVGLFTKGGAEALRQVDVQDVLRKIAS